MLNMIIKSLLSHSGNITNSLPFARSVDLPIDDDDNHTAVIVCSAFFLGVTLSMLCSSFYSTRMTLASRLVRCVASILAVSGWVAVGICQIIHRYGLVAELVGILQRVGQVALLSTVLIHKCYIALKACFVAIPSLLPNCGIPRDAIAAAASLVKLPLDYEKHATAVFCFAFFFGLTLALLWCVQYIDRMSFEMRLLTCVLSNVVWIGWCLAALVRILHDHAALVEALSTPMTMICFLVGIIVLLVSFFLSWALQKKVPREPIQVDTKSLRGIPEKAAKKTHRVRFAPDTTVIIVERWIPGLGQEFMEMVARNTEEVMEERWLEQWKKLEAAAAVALNWEVAAAAAVAKTQSQLHSLSYIISP